MATLVELLAVAVQHHQEGRLQAAEQIYRQILAVDPNHPDAWHLLGVIASQVGRHDLAESYILRAIEQNPTEPAFFSNLGNALRAQRKFDEAISSFRRGLALKPDDAGTLYNLGIVFNDEQKYAEAEGCFQQALRLAPEFAEAHNYLGSVFQAQKKHEEAVTCYRRALELKPDLAEVHNNLGAVLRAERRLAEATAHFCRAVEIQPDYALAHHNLANVYQDAGELDRAVAAYRRVLELKPEWADAHRNLGTALQSQGKRDAAAACYERALELAPDFEHAQNALSMLRLQQGDFESVWPEWAWPLKSDPWQLWNGDPLGKQTILLHVNQGFGDAIQFVRYSALVKKQNPEATILLKCQRPIIRLMATCGGIDRVVAAEDQAPPFHVHLPLLGAPHILRTTLETIPRNVPYLVADHELIGEWREKMAGISGWRIGINWAGRTGPGEHLTRDIPLEHFAALGEMPDVCLVGLQKNEGSEKHAGAREGLTIFDPGPDFDTVEGAFMDTAAIMMNLDLVITSDTSIAHLAGALGVKVWVALPYVADWRWMMERDDSPWYPTMRLFRQRAAGDWEGVFEEIDAALRERLT